MRRAQPGDEPGDRRAHRRCRRRAPGTAGRRLACLPNGEPLVADLAEQPPRALGQRLAAEAARAPSASRSGGSSPPTSSTPVSRLSATSATLAISASAAPPRPARPPRRRAARRPRRRARRGRESVVAEQRVHRGARREPADATARAPKSRLSTTNTQASSAITDATWLRTIAPSPTPIPPQSAVADASSRAGAARSSPPSSAAVDVAAGEDQRADPERERLGRRRRTTNPASRPAASFAATTRDRCGVKRKVGRIVPKRYSLAITSTPASAAKSAARPPMPSRLRWSSSPASENVVAERGRSGARSAARGRPCRAAARSSSASSGSSAARRASARSRLAAPRSARGRPARARSPAATSSCSTTPAGRRDLADAVGRRAAHEQHAVAVGRRRRCPRARAPPAARRPAGCARAPTPPSARRQLVERRLGDEPAAVDDQHAVDRLRDLGQHVARHEHRPAAGRERAQEVAQPAHALRVEPVGRLVEDEQLRLAEQRRRRGRAAAACRASSP